eukprot:1073047-Rhodomonas_salina.2
MANQGQSHIVAAKRILRYAKGTSTVGITYTAGAAVANQLYAYVDADHAGDPKGRRSVTGYCVTDDEQRCCVFGVEATEGDSAQLC